MAQEKIAFAIVRRSDLIGCLHQCPFCRAPHDIQNEEPIQCRCGCMIVSDDTPIYADTAISISPKPFWCIQCKGTFSVQECPFCNVPTICSN